MFVQPKRKVPGWWYLAFIFYCQQCAIFVSCNNKVSIQRPHCCNVLVCPLKILLKLWFLLIVLLSWLCDLIALISFDAVSSVCLLLNNLHCFFCLGDSEKASNQYAHVNCGNCRTMLMYPSGAPSVKCAICQFITNVGAGNPRVSVPPQRIDGPPSGTTPSTSTSMPQSTQTVVVENPMSVDESGKLVTNVVVGVTTEKRWSIANSWIWIWRLVVHTLWERHWHQYWSPQYIQIPVAVLRIL